MMIKKLLFLFLNILFVQINAQSFEEYAFIDDEIPFNNEVKVADLDGDGDKDIVTLSYQERIITIGDYDAASNTITTDTINSTFSARFMDLFDIDADGLIDIVVSAPFESSFYYWKNLGNFSFEITMSTLEDYTGIHAVDLNNDGFLEMIVSSADKLIAYSLQNGNINYYMDIDPGGFSFRPKAITSFDKNGDGLMDLIAADDFDGIIYYEQETSGSFTRTDLLPEVFSVEHIEVADFNNDGFFDIFAQSAFNGSAKIQINNGDDTFTETQIPADIERIDLAFVMDYDSDGDEDIIYYDSGFGSPGIINAFENNNGSFSKSEFSTNYQRIETGIAGDLDNDGDADMVFADNDFFDPAIIIYKNNLSVGIATQELSDFEVFPSLVSDNFIIKSKEKLDVIIYNAVGQVLIKGTMQGEELFDLNNFPSGNYFVGLNNHEAKAMVKIVKL